MNSGKPQHCGAVFLDRDGTLIEEKTYLCRPELVALFPGASQALRRLREGGFRLFLVTNQAGVGRGYFTMADVEKVHARLVGDLAAEGIQFEKIYVAPKRRTSPRGGASLRRNSSGMRAIEFGVALSESYMVGDKLIDLQCGWNAGVKQSILVRTGYGAEVARAQPSGLDRAVIVDDLVAAADWVLAPPVVTS